MALSYQDLINKGKQQRNALDSIMGFFGQGIDNENYVPGVDLDGNVKGLTFGERMSGISMDEKRAANAAIQKRAKENLETYKFLDSEGVAPVLSQDVSDADLAKGVRDFKDIRTAEVAARRVGVDDELIAKYKNSGLGASAIASSLFDATRKQKIENEKANYVGSQQYIDAKEARDYNRDLAESERIYQRKRDERQDKLLAFEREQAAQLRRDQMIENKEARLGNQELAMLQLNRDERMHNNELEYRRELHKRERIDNIAASLSSLAMSFFV